MVWVHLAHFWKIRLFLALLSAPVEGASGDKKFHQMLPILEHSKRAKNSQFSKKCASIWCFFCHQMLPLLKYSKVSKIAQFSKNVPNAP